MEYTLFKGKIQRRGVMNMKIQLIRNATMVVDYAGKKFLIDPMLAEKGLIRLSQMHQDKIKVIL